MAIHATRVLGHRNLTAMALESHQSLSEVIKFQQKPHQH